MSKSNPRDLEKNLKQFIEVMKPKMNAVIENVSPLQYKEQIVILTSMINALKNENLASDSASGWNENLPITPELQQLIIGGYKDIRAAYKSRQSYNPDKFPHSLEKFDPAEYYTQGGEKLQEYLQEQVTYLEKKQELIEGLAKIVGDDVKSYNQIYDQTVQNFLDQDFESNKKQEFSKQIQRIYEKMTQNMRYRIGGPQGLLLVDYIAKELPLRQEQWQQQCKKEYKLAVGLYNINLQLEKTLDKEQSNQLLQDKQQLITQYKETLPQTETFLKTQPLDVRIKRKPSYLTEYRSIENGILTEEEAEAIDNYQLLNMWDEINPEDHPSKYMRLQNLLQTIATYYPEDKLKGFKELSAMHYDKAFVVLESHGDILSCRYITPADLTYMTTAEELKLLYSVAGMHNFEDLLFQVGAVKTFAKFIEDKNRPKIKPIETLQLMHAILTNNKPEIEKYLITGVKLDNNTSSLLLHRVKQASDMSELKQFIPILDLTATIARKTILHLASEYGDLDLVKLLIEMGADVNASTIIKLGGGHTSTSGTPLHLAAQYGHLEVVKLLLNNRAHVNATNEDYKPPMDLALTGNHSEVAKILIEKGADVKGRGGTWLQLAARYGDAEVVKLLIVGGANVNCGARGIEETPLHIAARYGHFEVVKLLIKEGADVDAKGEWKEFKGHRGNYVDTAGKLRGEPTPLHVAAQYGRLDIVKLLIESGAKVKARDQDGYIPLHLAARSGNADVVKVLIEGGSDANSKGKWGSTPLHLAAEYKHLNVVKLLIEECGADINQVDSKGNYALSTKVIQTNATMMFEAVMTKINKNPPEKRVAELTDVISKLEDRTDAKSKNMPSFIKRFREEHKKQIAQQVQLSPRHINPESPSTSGTVPSTMPKPPSGRNF